MNITKHFNVKSESEAWKIAHELFPTDYEKDEISSMNAGYSIYRSTLRNDDTDYYKYICDLGDRLEINLSDRNEDGKWISKTINIWISKVDVEGVRRKLANRTMELYK